MANVEPELPADDAGRMVDCEEAHSGVMVYLRMADCLDGMAGVLCHFDRDGGNNTRLAAGQRQWRLASVRRPTLQLPTRRAW